MVKKRAAEIRIPPGAMVDTMVLIHAVKVPNPARLKPDLLEEAQERHRSYRWLLASMAPVRVSAATWTEFLRFQPEHERAKLMKLTSAVDVISIDDEVAELAADLLYRKHGAPEVCEKCLSHTFERATPCSVCHAVKAPRQHSIDAMNVACASVYRVPVLYSQEKVGVPHLASLLPEDKKVVVAPPPSADGELGEYVRRKRNG